MMKIRPTTSNARCKYLMRSVSAMFLSFMLWNRTAALWFFRQMVPRHQTAYQGFTIFGFRLSGSMLQIKPRSWSSLTIASGLARFCPVGRSFRLCSGKAASFRGRCLPLTGQSLPTSLLLPEFSGFCGDLDEPIGEAVEKTTIGSLWKRPAEHFQDVL